VTTPVRTCVGCGARAAQGELVRFVAIADALALDDRRRLPGRGAYLHRQPACWTAFVRRRGTVRSLRAAPSQAAREALVDRLAARAEAG
jgi:predicted RNA-binding protein YlxR (DUF448 family)